MFDKQFHVELFQIDRVIPVCLPINEPVRSLKLIGKYPYIAGWGRSKEGEPTSDVLREQRLLILENSVCKSRFEKRDFPTTGKQFDERVLCAGEHKHEKSSFHLYSNVLIFIIIISR